MGDAHLETRVLSLLWQELPVEHSQSSSKMTAELLPPEEELVSEHDFFDFNANPLSEDTEEDTLLPDTSFETCTSDRFISKMPRTRSQIQKSNGSAHDYKR